MEITGFFVLTMSTSALGFATWLAISQILRKKKREEKIERVEKILKELKELHRSLDEQTYRSLNLMFLDKARDLLNGQKNLHDSFLFNELKYASLYLEQFIKSLRIKNKNPYLLYKTKHFILKGMEKIEDFYFKNEIERILLSLENLKLFS